MILDGRKFIIDESQSNPMVIALKYPDCPIEEICAWMSIGFGNMVKHCPSLNAGEKMECLKG